jgi:hypothetical protein
VRAGESPAATSIEAISPFGPHRNPQWLTTAIPVFLDTGFTAAQWPFGAGGPGAVSAKAVRSAGS